MLLKWLEIQLNKPMKNFSPGQETKNHINQKLLVQSNANLSDVVLTQSYVDGQFLVDLKKRARTGSFKQMFSPAIAKFDLDNSSKCCLSVQATFVKQSEKQRLKMTHSLIKHFHQQVRCHSKNSI